MARADGDPASTAAPSRPASSRRPVRREGAEHYLFLTLISFAGTVIATRSFLELTGYPYIGEYTPSMEMVGVHLTLMKLDDELGALLKEPTEAPGWHSWS